jgi:hypothetical protein
VLFCNIDRLNFRDQVPYAYRTEHLAEWDRDVSAIELVVADTNVVIGVSVDEQYLNFAGESADLVELARSTNSCPQTRKSTTEYENPRHLHSP